MMTGIFVLMLIACALSQSLSFTPSHTLARFPSASSLKMQSELNPDEGYGPFGSLTRQGPVPYFIRITKKETYDAAVTKYQMQEKCSRLEAMANMDAYFADPNGWAGNKLREKNGTIEPIDYINVNQGSKNLTLTAIWAFGIIGLFVRIAQVQLSLM